MSIQLQKPEHFVIYVSDMVRSIAFYRDTLGLPVQFSAPGFTVFNNEGTKLALHQHMDGETRPAEPTAGQATVVFVVDDIQNAYETLKVDGIEFASPPQKQRSGLILAAFYDPDGFRITLQQGQI
jgi:lactoylglutathione lyase